MAFTRKVLAGLVTIVTVVLGLSLATAGTATADTGYWRPYGNTNPITSSSSTWECGSSLRLYGTNVVAQTCAIKSPRGTAAQAAVIVRNNQSSTYIISAATDLRRTGTGAGTILGVWHCPSSGVAANTWSVCFGRTLDYQGWVRSMGSVNNTDNLPESGWV